LNTFSSYRNLNNALRNRKGSLGLVPTMGSLHNGHLSLVEKAVKKNSNVIVSIFVNPTQFDNKSDLENYPQNLKNDLEQLQKFNNVLVYVPDIKDLYPKNTSSKKYNFGRLDKIMEGKSRVNHFNGVATIVEKLFKIFKPNFAYFGEKDFQQLIIIKSLLKQKSLKVKIISCPTVRENDGLAMSSRNKLLNKKERKTATVLYRTLLEAKGLMNSSEPTEIEKTISTKFSNIKDVDLLYFKILTEGSFADLKNLKDKENFRAFIACNIGNVRLIDNMILE
jgi:pantoate--beta-alanine ligase